MRRREPFLLAMLVLLLAACQPGAEDAKVLDQMQQTHDPGVVARMPVSCSSVSELCARIYEEHAAACLDLANSADPATRAAMQTCAVNDFHQALAHLPPTGNKLVATKGLAAAVSMSRDNASNATADIAELDRLASELQGMPGGAPYGAYYAANNDVFRVLTRRVPADQACATLKNAGTLLPRENVPQDLNQHLADLRTKLNLAVANRSCG